MFSSMHHHGSEYCCCSQTHAVSATSSPASGAIRLPLRRCTGDVWYQPVIGYNPMTSRLRPKADATSSETISMINRTSSKAPYVERTTIDTFGVEARSHLGRLTVTGQCLNDDRNRNLMTAMTMTSSDAVIQLRRRRRSMRR